MPDRTESDDQSAEEQDASRVGDEGAAEPVLSAPGSSEDTTEWLKDLAGPDDLWTTTAAAHSDEPRKFDVSASRRRPASGAMWIAAAIGLVIVGGALVAAAFLFGGDGSSGQSGPGTNGGGEVSTGSTGLPSTQGSATVVPEGSEGLPTSATTAPGVTAPRPSVPATRGAELETLNVTPAKTITLVNLPKGFKGASWAVTFEPYGWGPGGQEGGRLIVRVTTAEPKGDAEAIVEVLAGANASLSAEPGVAAVVTGGGTYAGVVVVRPQADVGTLVLESASVKE